MITKSIDRQTFEAFLREDFFKRPHSVSSANNRLYYHFSTSLTKIEKQSILFN